MDTHSFEFREVLSILDDIPAINAGGCGVSALAIYRWCQKHRIPMDSNPFVILIEDEYEYHHNNDCIENGDLLSIGIPHIVIEINGVLFDSTGSEDDNPNFLRGFEYRQDYQLDESDLLALLNEHGWNDSFNRRYVSDIEESLGINLSDVDRSIQW